MLKVPPKSWLRFGFKVGVAGAIIEAASLAGSYFGWRKLNSDQEFRQYCNTNFPIALEAYYKIGDYWDPEKTKDLRELDQLSFAKAIKDQENKKPDN